MGWGILSALAGAPVAAGSLIKNYVDGKGGSSGSGKGPIVGYANGQPIYQSTAMNGVDTSGMGTKAQQQAAGTAEGKTAATMGGYNPATLPVGSATPTAPQQPASQQTYGTASGPGIMQQWFGSQASGQNPAWDYMRKRASTALDNAYGARGAFNSGAAVQGQGDLNANENAQEMGLLTQEAQGASNEQQNQINSMFGVGMGLANGGAGLAGGYDTGAANAMSSANGTAMNLGMQGAMVPYMANQGFMKNLFGLGGTALGAAAGG